MPAPAPRGAVRSGAVEWRALLGLTRPEPRAPSEEPDWALLVDIAERHKSQLLLARGIGKAGIDIPCAAARSRLADLRARGTVRALHLAGETARVVGALEAAGVPALSIKGAPLSLAVYGDVALRSPGDIDIHVPPEHVERTARILFSLGYASSQASLLRTPRARDRLFRVGKDIAFRHPQAKILLECHWRLGARLDASLTDRSPADGGGTRVAIGAVRVPTLDPVRSFIHLCHHGAWHLWSRLKWFDDIRWMLAKPDLDGHGWGLVARRAGELRLARVVASAVLLVERLDGTAPPPALRALADDAPGARDDAARFVAWLEETGGLAEDPEPTIRRRHRMITWGHRLSARDGESAPGVFSGFLTPSQSDLCMADLPVAMEWAYPLLRAYRVTRDALPRKS